MIFRASSVASESKCMGKHAPSPALICALTDWKCSAAVGSDARSMTFSSVSMLGPPPPRAASGPSRGAPARACASASKMFAFSSSVVVASPPTSTVALGHIADDGAPDEAPGRGSARERISSRSTDATERSRGRRSPERRRRRRSRARGGGRTRQRTTRCATEDAANASRRARRGRLAVRPRRRVVRGERRDAAAVQAPPAERTPERRGATPSPLGA